MNTYDIRNTNTRQWIFWATAIPVTILVMGLAIVAVLKFDPLRGVWARLVERDRRQRVGREEETGQGVDGGLVVPQRRPTTPYETPPPPPRGSPRV